MIRRNAPLLLFAVLCVLDAAGCANPLAATRLTCAGLDRTVTVQRTALADYTEAFNERIKERAKVASSQADLDALTAEVATFTAARSKVRVQIASTHAAVGLCESTVLLVETKVKDPRVLGPIVADLAKAVDGIVAAVRDLTGGVK